MKVFVGGSRTFSRLNANIRARLDAIMASGMTILVGDANGADKAVQSYLSSHEYSTVIVFVVGRVPRNNIGGWSVATIGHARVRRGFEHYALKDRAMSREADYGLMLWDGKSRGTLYNIADLVSQSKPILVYFRPAKAFCKVKDLATFRQMLAHAPQETQRLFERELATTLSSFTTPSQLSLEHIGLGS